MKKTLLLLIILVTSVAALASCGKKYKPVASTAEESKVVMTFKIDEEEYKIRYELYRMLFLNNHSLVDNGDTSVWSGENKDEYIKEMDELIVSHAAEIYSVLHLAEVSGINPYSKEIDNKIYENIRVSVEGNGSDVLGHGTYEKYLASLKKEKNMNYSVAVLLMRYALVYDEITALFAGEEHEVFGKLEGALEYTEEDVKDYYYGEDSARILHMFFAKEVKSYEKMCEYQIALDECDSPEEAASYIMGTFCPVIDTDIFVNKKVSGITVGKHELDRSQYAEYTDAALSLLPGETSEVLNVRQDKDYYYIIYKLEKTDEYFKEHYERVEVSYIDNTIGSLIFEVKEELIGSLDKNEGYSNINHAQVLDIASEANAK